MSGRLIDGVFHPDADNTGGRDASTTAWWQWAEKLQGGGFRIVRDPVRIGECEACDGRGWHQDGKDSRRECGGCHGTGRIVNDP